MRGFWPDQPISFCFCCASLFFPAVGGVGCSEEEKENWIGDKSEFKKIGLDTARGVLDASVAELVKRTDLEEETIVDVQRILKEEFEE